MAGAESSGPRLIPPRRLGPLEVRAWIARGRRADVWWADSETGSLALRIPHPSHPRSQFDREQTRAYAASGRRGDLRPEGALEALVRGDNFQHLQYGAARNGPVSESQLVSLTQGVLFALAEYTHGHGDLVANHILIDEAGLVRLIDANPEGFLAAPERRGPGSGLLVGSTVFASDLMTAAFLLRSIWMGGRHPDETPPAWLQQLPQQNEAIRGLEWLQEVVGPIDPSAAVGDRARLLIRLCPERRTAWASIERPHDPAPPVVPPLLESEESLQPTNVDFVEDNPYLGDNPGLPEVQSLNIEPDADSEDPTPPPLVLGAAVEPPPLNAPDEALVPTHIVRARGATAGSDDGLGRRPIKPERDDIVDLEVRKQEPAGADGSPVQRPDPTRLLRMPPRPREPEVEPDDMVVPVPDAELARLRRDRRLAIALGLLVAALAALVTVLAMDRLGLMAAAS